MGRQRDQYRAIYEQQKEADQLIRINQVTAAMINGTAPPTCRWRPSTPAGPRAARCDHRACAKVEASGRCVTPSSSSRNGKRRTGYSCPGRCVFTNSQALIDLPTDLRSARLDDPLTHRGLGRLGPAARVVHLLVARVAVDLQHTVVVAEHVAGDGPGVGTYWVSVSTFILTTP